MAEQNDNTALNDLQSRTTSAGDFPDLLLQVLTLFMKKNITVLIIYLEQNRIFLATLQVYDEDEPQRIWGNVEKLKDVVSV